MAVNHSDKKSLLDAVLPEVQFDVNTSGVTITSERFNTPRIIKFDLPGKCRNCKSSDLELDYVVTKDGITLYSSRIKGSKFIAFDHTHDYPEHCFFRLKSRGHVYNIPHGPQVPSPAKRAAVLEESRKRPSDQQSIDQFLKLKQVKQEAFDSEGVEFLYEGPSTSGKENNKPEEEVEEIGPADGEEEEVNSLATED